MLFFALALATFVAPLNRDPVNSITINSTNVSKRLLPIIEQDIIACGFTKIDNSEEADYSATVEQNKNGVAIAIKNSHATFNYNVPYTNNSKEDRKAIHKALAKASYDIFHRKGIQDKNIIFAVRKKTSKWESEIWYADYDGANARQLTYNGNCAISPRFLPKHNAFIYVTYANKVPKIIAASLNHGKESPLLSSRGSQMLPAVSKSGRWVAFTADISGNCTVFMQHLGQHYFRPIKILSTKYTQAGASFNNDETKIALASDRTGSPRIYIYDFSTKPPCLKMISKKYRINSAPNWSPDGTKIVYSSLINGIQQLCIYDIERCQESQLTFGTINCDNSTLR